MQPDIPSRMLPTSEAAKMLGVSESWLEKKRVTGGGVPFIRLGRRIVYDPHDLIKWARMHRFTSTSDREPRILAEVMSDS